MPLQWLVRAGEVPQEGPRGAEVCGALLQQVSRAAGWLLALGTAVAVLGRSKHPCLRAAGILETS